MPNHARLILSDYGDFGWGVSSPDLPELVSGAQARSDLTDEFLLHVALGAGLAHGGSIDVYDELLVTDGQHYFGVRAKRDFHFNERARLAEEAGDALARIEDLRDYATRNDAGDAILIACVPGDSIATATGSLVPGDLATLVLRRNGKPQYLGIGHGQKGDIPDDYHKASEFGFNASTTVSELFDKLDRSGDFSSIGAGRELVALP